MRFYGSLPKVFLTGVHKKNFWIWAAARKYRKQNEDKYKPGLDLLLGEKCLKLATLRLIADNISFLGGRLDQARIVKGKGGVAASHGQI